MGRAAPGGVDGAGLAAVGADGAWGVGRSGRGAWTVGAGADWGAAVAIGEVGVTAAGGAMAAGVAGVGVVAIPLAAAGGLGKRKDLMLSRMVGGLFCPSS
ncbi:MAG: hypothetical protein NTY77_10800 [Elusimicrobia bacterium]|nr:hypothetical protein [Elusimicrobiota bacterium]